MTSDIAYSENEEYNQSYKNHKDMLNKIENVMVSAAVRHLYKPKRVGSSLSPVG